MADDVRYSTNREGDRLAKLFVGNEIVATIIWSETDDGVNFKEILVPEVHKGNGYFKRLIRFVVGDLIVDGKLPAGGNFEVTTDGLKLDGVMCSTPIRPEVVAWANETILDVNPADGSRADELVAEGRLSEVEAKSVKVPVLSEKTDMVSVRSERADVGVDVVVDALDVDAESGGMPDLLLPDE